MNKIVSLRKNSILADNVNKKDNSLSLSYVKVGLDNTNSKPVETVPAKNGIGLATKLGVTAFTTAVIVSPPIAGYFIFGKTGLVLGTLAAIPLAVVGGLVLVPVWLADSYN